MYTAYFGIQRNPFALTPDPRFLYLSPQHREALAHLTFGTQEGGGFVQLTGEVGTGKTTVCRALLEQLPETVDSALILDPTLTPVELLANVCREFGVAVPPGEPSRQALVERLNQHLLEANGAGRRALLIIDEAQNLGPELLEQLRLLTNLETADSKLLQIFLIGQPELREQLARHDLRQVAQRITARYHLGPLSPGDTTAYVEHRLAVAGAERALFSPGALRTVHRLSRGTPRLINMLCDRALLGAYATGTPRVTRTIVKRAARELGNARHQSPRSWRRVHPAVAIAGALAAAAFILHMALNGLQGGRFAPAVDLTAEPAAGRSIPDPSAPSPPLAGGTAAQAWARLATLWGLADAAAGGCAPAPTGLACLEDRGDLALLDRLNRPAVLPLRAPGGTVWTVLEGLAGDHIRLYTPAGALTLAREGLERRWDGRFQLWWRPPFEGPRVVEPAGAAGPVADWLRRVLPPLTEPGGDLRARVRAFQAAQGLITDGIVGPHTLIRLNDHTARTDVVRLQREQP